MRRFVLVWLSIVLVALLATFLLAMPQATAVGAAERGLVASGLTLAAFFLALLLAAALVASALALALAALLGRLSRPLPGAGRAVLGALGMLLALLVVPGLGELLGFLGAWIASGAAGMASVVDDAAGRPRIAWRRLLLGGLAAIAVGLALLALASARAV